MAHAADRTENNDYASIVQMSDTSDGGTPGAISHGFDYLIVNQKGCIKQSKIYLFENSESACKTLNADVQDQLVGSWRNITRCTPTLMNH